MKILTTRNLGTVSCILALLAGIVYLGVALSKEYHPNFIFFFFISGVAGLLLGIAGLVSSLWQGRASMLSILGIALNLAPAYVGFVATAIMFGQQH